VKAAWGREPQLIWSFWAAAAFVALGGAIPFLVGGSSSRIASVFIPFAVAALAFAACALVHEQGRAITSALYLLAGLAIVYGFLTMFALPLQLAVLGTCPIPPQPCASGLQHALTVSENTGIGAAAAFGIAALFIGFFGLVVVYRRTAPAAPPAPPVRTIPPVTPRAVKPAAATPAAAEPAAAEAPKADDGAAPAEAKPAAEVDLPEPAAKAAVEELPEPQAEPEAKAAVVELPKPRPKRMPKPKAKAEVKELPEPAPELELPAHEEAERPELPPYESTTT
jgi:hypothetical protein